MDKRNQDGWVDKGGKRVLDRGGGWYCLTATAYKSQMGVSPLDNVILLAFTWAERSNPVIGQSTGTSIIICIQREGEDDEEEELRS